MTLVSEAGEAIRSSNADAWLVHSFRGGNPVFTQLVGTRLFMTRRAFILIKPDEAPWLLDHLAGLSTVAMEYSPMGELPAMSWVDGGTLDLVRSTGVTVVSSAELFQRSAAAWSDDARASHERAMRHVVEIKDDAFAEIQRLLSDGSPCDEHLVQTRITDAFAARGLMTDDPPVVAVNANSGDPHYVPSSDRHDPIAAGDWVLIDLWAKGRGPEAVFADITWVGYAGSAVPQRHRET